MLLRRVIEHVKAQNWTAVVIDFIMGLFSAVPAVKLSQNINLPAGRSAAIKQRSFTK